MLNLIGKERWTFGVDTGWHDVWRVTCDVCGATEAGIDALVTVQEAGWFHEGPLDECPTCITKVPE